MTTALAPRLGAVTFQRERAHTLWQEAYPLFVKHWQEISHYPDILLDINVAAYCAAEDAGNLRCFTARRKPDGALLGYCVFFVRHNLRYQASLQAVQDVLFVLPDQRGRRVGVGLIRFTEKALRAEGVQVVYQHVKATRNEGELLARLGYELVDLIYGKRLDREER